MSYSRLDLRQGRVGRDVDVEHMQARECAVDGLGIFRLQGMKQDLQTIDGRLIDLRSLVLQQLRDQLLGFFEVTAQKLALRAFEPHVEH